MLHRKWYFSLKMRFLWYFYDTLCHISREVSLLITDNISVSYNDIEYQKWYFDTFSSKNKLTCMNHINLANHLQNLIYYKDEYRLFYPRTPADIRHNRKTSGLRSSFFAHWRRYWMAILSNIRLSFKTCCKDTTYFQKSKRKQVKIKHFQTKNTVFLIYIQTKTFISHSISKPKILNLDVYPNQKYNHSAICKLH